MRGSIPNGESVGRKIESGRAPAVRGARILAGQPIGIPFADVPAQRGQQFKGQGSSRSRAPLGDPVVEVQEAIRTAARHEGRLRLPLGHRPGRRGEEENGQATQEPGTQGSEGDDQSRRGQIQRHAPARRREVQVMRRKGQAGPKEGQENAEAPANAVQRPSSFGGAATERWRSHRGWGRYGHPASSLPHLKNHKLTSLIYGVHNVC